MKILTILFFYIVLTGCAGIDYLKTDTDQLIRISLSVNQIRALYEQAMSRELTNTFRTDKYVIEITR